MKHTTAQFDFEAKPKVTAVKQKYREYDRMDGTNLMNDPRVVRGNTYAAIVENKNEVQPPPRKTTAPKPKQRVNFDTGFQISTPHAVEGREHFSIQTQPFVETLRDRPINYQIESQTDLFLDRPVERTFTPLKTGTDHSTQIQENEPQLFDFDHEVQPIIDALLNKVFETSRMELYEEKQLQEKESQKQNYQKKRHAKLAEAQRLEAAENRLSQQAKRRQLQYRVYAQQHRYEESKVIARVLSKQLLSHLKQNTYKVVENEGFFRDPLQTYLLSEYAPWLYSRVAEEINLLQNYGRKVEAMIEESEKDMLEESNKAVQKQKKRREDVLKQKKQKKQQKQRIKQQKKQMKRLKEEQQMNKVEEPPAQP